MNNLVTRALTGLALILFIIVPLIYLPPLYFSSAITIIGAYTVIVEWPALCTFTTLSCWLFTLFYPITPFALLIALNQQLMYRPLLLLLFAAVAAHDTGAYLIGKLIGAHPIAPGISDKKTVEGFIGGCLCASLALGIVLHLLGGTHNLLTIALLGVLVSLFAFAGDLFESLLKRRAGIKDSGSILPGHGGFLDRFDGILFAAFFFYAARAWLVSLFF